MPVFPVFFLFSGFRGNFLPEQAVSISVKSFLHFHAAEYGIRACGVLYYIGYHSILGE